MDHSIRYIVDDQGNRKEVVIPITLWDSMVQDKHMPTRQTKKRLSMNKEKLKKFVGSISLSIDPLKFQKAIRDEWK